LTDWLEETPDGVAVRLHVVPNASRTRVDGPHGDALKIHLQTPPADGRANRELIRLLAATVGCAKSDVRLAAGAASRRKTVILRGIDASVRERLEGAP
jgi:uncharacterized protein